MKRTFMRMILACGALTALSSAATTTGYIDYIWTRTDNGLIAIKLTSGSEWYLLSHNSAVTPSVLILGLTSKIANTQVIIDWTASGSDRLIDAVRQK